MNEEYELYEKYPVSIGTRRVGPYYKGVLKMTPKDDFTILVQSKSVVRTMCIVYMDNVKIDKCPMAPDMHSNLVDYKKEKRISGHTLGYTFFRVKNPATKRYNFYFVKDQVNWRFVFYPEELSRDTIGFLEVCKKSKDLDWSTMEKIKEIYSKPIIFDPDNKESFDVQLVSKYLE